MSDHDRSILDQIAQDARVMRRARMLPTDRPLTPPEIDQVARDAKAFLRERRISNGKLSRMLGEGYSESVLSQFLNGVYKGDCEKIARAVNAHMERMASAAQVSRPEGFVETEVCKRMLAAIRLGVETSSLVEIVGPAGVGKTMTLRAAHAMYPGSLYFRAIHGTRSPSGLIIDVAQALGVQRRGTIATTQRLVIDALKGTGRPIFLDQAHDFRPSTLDVVLDIHDEAGVPFILCGTKRLREMTGDRQRYFGQFNRRIVARCDVTDVVNRASNPRPLYTVDEIKRVFSSGQLRLTTDGAQYLTDLANLPDEGALGLCEKVITTAGRLTQLKDKPIDAAILSKVFRQMHGAAYATWASEKIKAAPKKAAVA